MTDLEARHVLAWALILTHPPATPGDAPHGINLPGETDPC